MKRTFCPKPLQFDLCPTDKDLKMIEKMRTLRERKGVAPWMRFTGDRRAVAWTFVRDSLDEPSVADMRVLLNRYVEKLFLRIRDGLSEHGYDYEGPAILSVNYAHKQNLEWHVHGSPDAVFVRFSSEIPTEVIVEGEYEMDYDGHNKDFHPEFWSTNLGNPFHEAFGRRLLQSRVSVLPWIVSVFGENDFHRKTNDIPHSHRPRVAMFARVKRTG